jgi:hypothetical protein
MIHAGDVGTKIRIVPDDGTSLSGATDVQLRLKKPSNEVITRDAAIVDGAVEYITEEGDIDLAGKWALQAYVDLTTWRGSSKIVFVTVGGALG